MARRGRVRAQTWPAFTEFTIMGEESRKPIIYPLLGGYRASMIVGSRLLAVFAVALAKWRMNNNIATLLMRGRGLEMVWIGGG